MWRWGCVKAGSPEVGSGCGAAIHCFRLVLVDPPPHRIVPGSPAHGRTARGSSCATHPSQSGHVVGSRGAAHSSTSGTALGLRGLSCEESRDRDHGLSKVPEEEGSRGPDRPVRSGFRALKPPSLTTTLKCWSVPTSATSTMRGPRAMEQPLLKTGSSQMSGSSDSAAGALAAAGPPRPVRRAERAGLVPMPSIGVDGDGARRTNPRFAEVSARVAFHAFIERGDSTEAGAAPVPARFEELFRSP